GGLLAVTEASPVAEDSRLQVAVIEGRWLRVSSTDPQLVDPVQAITYTVSNGSTSGVGSLTLTQEEPLPAEQNSPVPEDDKVTVRAGSVIEIPVLDNDTTPSGDPVALVPVPEDKERELSVGEYSVLPAGDKSGQAVMAGRRVRFLAPDDDGTLPRDVRIQYAVANTGDPMAPAAMGLVYVHITGEPDKNNPNQDPTPRAVEGRVVQGDTVALRLPPTGLDPDGDPVTIVSIGDTERGAPKLGRVTEINGASITYQAFPGSTGTDRFSYTVEDPFGKHATGIVSVAVVPPGPPQPPTAVDDLVTADTGRDLEVDVLTNDLRTSGTRLTVEPLENAPEGVSLDEETGLIKLTSPSGNNESMEIPYVATNGIDSSKAVLRVRTQKGFDNPPVADDILAAPKGNDDTVTVDVLKHVYDIDDATSDLELDPVKGAEDLGKGRLRIKVTDKAQVLPYQVTDPAGAVAVAAIRVSPIASGTPYLKPDALIKLDPGATKTVELADLVEDPEGDKVVFTTLDANAFFAAPEGRLRASASGTTLKLTAAKQTGPGTVTFTVSDREKLADPEANVAMLTVPVQVGSDKPVITCPSAPLRVAEGGRDLDIDVASVCHVWTADPAAAKGLEFKGSWAEQPPGIDLSNSGSKIRLRTGNGAKAGSRGQINVAVSGDEPTAKLNVLVTKLPAPTLSAISVDAHGGDPVKIDLAKYLQTKVTPSSRDIQLVSAKQVSGPQSRASSSGSVLTVTPGEDSFGVLSYRVEVSDMGKTSSRPRATGLVKVSVATRPDAPSGLSTSPELLSNTAALSWRAPNPNGAPITKYVVKYSGGSSGEQTCGASPCRITGLTNGEQYTFAVKAVNAEGESDWSNSASAKPDALSEAVGNLRVTRQWDRHVTLAWDKPANSNASSAKRYQIRWPGGSNETSSTQADLPVSSNGDNYNFTVVAINDTQLPGAPATTVGMGAGRPEAPGKPDFTQTDRAGSNQRAVVIKWGQVAANGPNPVEYQVSRAGLGRPLCDWQTGLTCADDLPLDGATHSYTVMARNAEATSPRAGSKAEYVSAASPAGTMEFAATPDPVRINSLVSTGVDRQVRIDFASGASHGKKNTVECQVNGASCGSWNYALGGASDIRTLSTSVNNGGTANVQLRACNGSSGGSQSGSSCSAWANASANPYGPIGNPSISASANGNSVNWSASWNANGKNVRVVITRNGNTLWSSNSTGSGSHSGGDAIGYSQTGNYVITVSDTANSGSQAGSPRAQKSANRSVTTPPPPPSVSVSKGASAQGQAGCTVAACRFVVVTTENFPGSVTCQITQAYPNTNGFLTWTQGGNETKQSPNYYGFPGKGITVECDAVSGSTTW
ncbi:MAG TPA: Ig-like domain-containing protein, partial [Marmoricola sp.]|nr:Ig-like domain-containing protein [Marmoricola sp.]